MVISCKKLWNLLIDRDMLKKDLAVLAGTGRSSMTKLGHNRNVNTDVLVICNALRCGLWDIMELVPEKEEGNDGIKKEKKC